MQTRAQRQRKQVAGACLLWRAKAGAQLRKHLQRAGVSSLSQPQLTHHAACQPRDQAPVSIHSALTHSRPPAGAPRLLPHSESHLDPARGCRPGLGRLFEGSHRLANPSSKALLSAEALGLLARAASACSGKADGADTGVQQLSQFPRFGKKDLLERLSALLKVQRANRGWKNRCSYTSLTLNWEDFSREPWGPVVQPRARCSGRCGCCSSTNSCSFPTHQSGIDFCSSRQWGHHAGKSKCILFLMQLKGGDESYLATLIISVKWRMVVCPCCCIYT